MDDTLSSADIDGYLTWKCFMFIFSPWALSEHSVSSLFAAQPSLL